MSSPNGRWAGALPHWRTRQILANSHLNSITSVMEGSSNVLGEALGYKVIPNGIFLDEHGTVRFTKFGGFSVDRPEDVAAVERLLAGAAGPPDGAAAAAAEAPARAAGASDRVTALEHGLGLLHQGDRAGAVAAWRRALAADPDNYVIRKQIWAVEHPDRFYPAIDWAWQKEQLARERSRAP